MGISWVVKLLESTLTFNDRFWHPRQVCELQHWMRAQQSTFLNIYLDLIMQSSQSISIVSTWAYYNHTITIVQNCAHNLAGARLNFCTKNVRIPCTGWAKTVYIFQCTISMERLRIKWHCFHQNVQRSHYTKDSDAIFYAVVKYSL